MGNNKKTDPLVKAFAIESVELLDQCGSFIHDVYESVALDEIGFGYAADALARTRDSAALLGCAKISDLSDRAEKLVLQAVEKWPEASEEVIRSFGLLISQVFMTLRNDIGEMHDGVPSDEPFEYTELCDGIDKQNRAFDGQIIQNEISKAKVEVIMAQDLQQTPATEEDVAGAQKLGPGKNKNEMISVSQSKLDSLVNIMGEIVITESMVASSPDLKDLPLDNFNKSARQLRKLTDQLQDIVMSIRMLPLSRTFQKMNRVVRDLNLEHGKQAELEFVGGDVEVDKNISDVIIEPLQCLVSNAVEHGLETPEERSKAQKSGPAKIILQAQNVGSDIVITVRDNGRGINKEAVCDVAEQRGLLTKPRSEYHDRDIYSMIMAAGLSTSANSGGEGMSTVRQQVEKIGGSVIIDSAPDEGTMVSIKIPLTLAIVDGMEVGVATDTFTIPITSINQIYKLSENTEILYDTDGTEMVMIRGITYPIIRLHSIYNIDTDVTDLADGILIIVESAGSHACIFTDRLLGEQQIVVKSFPHFFDRYMLKDRGLSGCTIMGDGSISLILDINNLLGAYRSDSSNMMHTAY